MFTFTPDYILIWFFCDDAFISIYVLFSDISTINKCLDLCTGLHCHCHSTLRNFSHIFPSPTPRHNITPVFCPPPRYLICLPPYPPTNTFTPHAQSPHIHTALSSTHSRLPIYTLSHNILIENYAHSAWIKIIIIIYQSGKE